jgi:PTH2 family peptidyl-tRNA hydrolase
MAMSFPEALSPESGERPVKQVIIIRRDLHMGRGKEIAQGAHASWAWMSRRMEIIEFDEYTGVVMLTPAEREWMTGKFTKIGLQVPGLDELMELQEQAEAAHLEAHLITDSGLTEFKGIQTITALAIGPDYADLIDPVTKELKRY